MTTHTQDELRHWCELAGMRINMIERGPDFQKVVTAEIPIWGWFSDEFPALLPYVAELLVGNVRVLESDDRCIGDHHSNALRGEVDSLSSEICMLATAAQRCRAAEKVLTE